MMNFQDIFEELLLTFGYQKFLEIHFLIFSIIKFFKKNCAKFDIYVKIGVFSGTFDENHFHQFNK